MENKPKTKKPKKTTTSQPLSSVPMEVIKQKIYEAVHNEELEKSVNDFLKKNQINKRSVDSRDAEILRNTISEYLDSFIVFGYNTEDQRVIIQNYKNAKDYDALMEFLNFVHYKFDNGEL